MPRAGHPENPQTGPRQKQPIEVVPGSLPVARPKGGQAHAVQCPKGLKDRDVRARFAQLLMSSGVASGVNGSDDNVLVQIPGHRAVRLTPGQWLVVTPMGAAARDDDAFRATFDLEDDAQPEASSPGGDQVPSPEGVPA
jgi:hypothetical protein